MKIEDDRTPEQRKTHTSIIVGTDTFLSGWGKATGGVSYAAWACRPELETMIFNRIQARSDMKRVRLVSDPYRPKGRGHLHIYVAND